MKTPTIQPVKTFNRLKMATPGQMAILVKLGHDAGASQLTVKQASDLISQLIETQKAENEATIEAAKKLSEQLSVFDLVETRTTLRKATSNEWTGPCPKCGGDNRFYCQHNFFACRHCHPKRGDYIECVSWLSGQTFLEACKSIADGSLPALPATPTTPAPKPAPVNDWNEPRQRQQAMRSHNELIAQRSDCARVAMAYLQWRGIDSETINAFKIGCRMTSLPGTWDEKANALTYPRQIAVSMPWLGMDGNLISVKYRFVVSHTYTAIDKGMRTENKTSRGQSGGHVFGWQALRGPGTVDTLIICEGEMNALSLWQAGGGRIDVLSTGTESTMQRLPAMVEVLAKQYSNVIVWADKGTIADSAARAINASSMRSPMNMDANDLLKSEKLEQMIDWMLKRVQSPQTPVIADITEYVGTDVNAATWRALQRRADELKWSIEAKPIQSGWHVSRLHFTSEVEEYAQSYT